MYLKCRIRAKTFHPRTGHPALNHSYFNYLFPKCRLKLKTRYRRR
ncbi:hypothetical protein NEICINOT_04476 [Neisseria cinerea ATCC 14685]|uniref:Uncharacterized protein n=1 Tax=Neisseria cinerea ATCC 14685 TaxID=546262 RepID=D0W480_NEICI|nr:hypothetical protein NEICINOT_04476 [Neisseria cinerea ATCC 14685]